MSKAAELAALIGSQSALSHRNFIINGAMQVAQRSTGTVTVSNGSNEGYSTLDRFMINMNNAVSGAVDMSQSSNAPEGFAHSLKLKCQTTNTTYTNTKLVEIRHKIEGQNLQLLGFGTSSAKPITVSWYMKTVNYTGPISLSLQTQDGTAQYYAKSITPTTSWARYTCTIPGSTSATIDNDSGSGMTVDFVVAGGSSGTNAASSDSTGFSTTRVDYRNDIGNLLANTSNEFYITGVQLEVGEQATPFEHRSFADELHRCKRYFQKSYLYEDAVGTNTSTGMYFCQRFDSNDRYFLLTKNFPVEMRATPTKEIRDRNNSSTDRINVYNGGGTRIDIASISGGDSKTIARFLDNDSGSGSDSVQEFHWTADAEL